jgi:anti-sigma factor RsiW
MSCEKYSDWMTHAAFGDLPAEREPELLAHAMECAACREALAHARAVHDFVDRGIESLVAGEPSPQFATHLRRRIAQECEPLRSPWTAWAPVSACALALAVVLAIMVAPSRSPWFWRSWSRAGPSTRNPILTLLPP